MNSLLLPVVLLLVGSLCWPSAVVATEYAPGYWKRGFERHWIKDGVTCYAVAGDQLYVGGRFQWIGDRRANHVARWDGQQWHAVGNGTRLPVRTMVNHAGELVAGAETYAGRSFLERWDGQQWHAMGEPLHGWVRDAISTGDELFVAIRPLSGTPVLQWNGKDWTAVGQAFESASVRSLYWFDGALYAGGYFWLGSGEGRARRSVMKLVEGKWVPVGDLNGGYVNDLIVTRDGVFAAGDNGLSVGTGIARFDGGSWVALGKPRGLTDHQHLALFQGHVVADDPDSGYPRRSHTGLARWNGEWESLTPADDTPYLLAGTDTYHGALPIGTMHLAGRVSLWREGTVSRLAEPGGSGLVGGGRVAAPFGDDLVVAGWFDEAGGVPARNIARWDGEQWAPLGAGVERGVKAVHEHQGTLFVGGLFQHENENWNHTVLQWQAGEWIPVMEVANRYAAVRRLHSTRHGLVASGSIVPRIVQSIAPRSGAALWDGETWAVLSNELPELVWSNFTTLHGELVVIARAADASRSSVYRWTGSVWERWLGTRGLVRVDELVGIDGRLCVTGLVQDALSGEFSSVGYWDGTYWRVLGRSLDSHVHFLTSVGGRIVAGSSDNHMRVLDGDDWLVIPQQPDGGVHAGTEWKGSLVLVGFFSRLGAISSVGIAQWEFVHPVSAPHPPGNQPAAIVILGSYPNPANPRTRIRLRAQGNGSVRLRITDARGRTVWSREWSDLPAGVHDVDWNGTDANGRPIASGIYRATATSGPSSHTTSIAIVR